MDDIFWRTKRLAAGVAISALLGVFCPCSDIRAQDASTDRAGELKELAAEVKSRFPATTLFRNGENGYNYFRIPAIVCSTKGTLLAFCEARQGGDASTIDLVLRRSMDNGQSWEDLQVIQNHKDYADFLGPEVKEISLNNPSPVVDTISSEHAGRINLIYNVENQFIFHISSDDDGLTWSPPKNISSGLINEGWGWIACGPGHAIQLQSGPKRGRLLVATDHRIGDGGHDRGPLGIHTLFSDDFGNTWQLGALDETYDDEFNANENLVAELRDGLLYFTVRDEGGNSPGNRGEAWSDDAGESYREHKEGRYRYVTPSSPVLDTPIVQSGLLGIQGADETGKDDLLIFSGPDLNGPSGGGRVDLRIRFSQDNAKTWQDGPLIHVGPAAYSDLTPIQQDETTIGILFEAGVTKGKHHDGIDFVLFPLERLSSGNEQ
ncbi:sialidase family protein [Planctomicrobium sp. SH668]|uniref:sialidase family protein n=1 Tax=Planctomicrobium sp. SH668 TaxID=3448126 RepID=UPI003F5C8A41